MNKTLLFLFFSFDLCYMENSPGCCGESSGTCSKCCVNYHLRKGQCEACPTGFFGERCSLQCSYPHYGVLCGSSCKIDGCPEDQCHMALGCLNQDSGRLRTTHINLGIETSRTIHGNETKNKQSRTTQEIQDASAKMTMFISKMEKLTHRWDFVSIAETPNTLKHQATNSDRPSTMIIQREIKSNSKDDLWLFPVLRQLGITFVVCLVVIMGLVGLFLCKKRRERASIKSLKISSPLRQDDAELGGVGTARNSNTLSSVYNDMSEITLRKADEKGRTDCMNSTNTYMEPLTRQELEFETSAHNPCYHDVVL